MFEQMILNSLSFDVYTGEPLILLKDSAKINSLLVSGSTQDVRYLMSEFSGSLPDSSSPYALLVNTLSSFGFTIKRLEIRHCKNDLQKGLIFIEDSIKCVIKKCRPIDVVILSSKLSEPVNVSRDLINLAVRETVFNKLDCSARSERDFLEDERLCSEKKILM